MPSFASVAPAAVQWGCPTRTTGPRVPAGQDRPLSRARSAKLCRRTFAAVRPTNTSWDVRATSAANRGFEAQNGAKIVAFVHGLDQILDVRECVAAREQMIDQLQTRHVSVVIHAHSAAFFRRREKAAVLVRPHVSHRCVADAREFVDRVLVAQRGACGRVRGAGRGRRRGGGRRVRHARNFTPLYGGGPARRSGCAFTVRSPAASKRPHPKSAASAWCRAICHA